MLKPSMHSVVYQIWPRSFKDSNGDGIGDIQGIISKLDYLKDLGINFIWLSPVFKSPNHDYGYDISDYYSIQEEFGTLADFEELIHQANLRKIGLLLDLVANHTSDEHPWYQAALKDKNSKYRDYYVFREGEKGKEPNNWISLFGGSAWSLVEGNTYSLNLFTPQQKDLNWENPEVRQEFAQVIKFWLNKGISGFRMDVINMIAKEAGYPSYQAHKKGYQFAKEKFVSLPKSHVYLQELYEAVLKDVPGLFVGEGLLINPNSAALYSGFNSQELDLMFHFDLAMLGCGPLGKYDFRKLYRWNVRDFKDIYFKWQLESQKQGFMMGNFLSNHDQPRAVSRYGNDKEYHVESAKLLSTLTLMSKGTPFIYQGEEIGMTNLKLEPQDWKDFEAINDYEVLQSMMHLPASLALSVIQKMTRDQARTPMQWDADAKAGFTTGQPWMVVNPNTEEINVKAQENDPASILAYTKQLIQLYQSHPVFCFGDFEPVLYTHKQMIGFVRKDTQKQYLILLNMSRHVATFKAEDTWCQASWVLSNLETSGPMVEKMVFAPYEARILEITLVDKGAT